jgi:hypothetical protein
MVGKSVNMLVGFLARAAFGYFFFVLQMKHLVLTTFENPLQPIASFFCHVAKTSSKVGVW